MTRDLYPIVTALRAEQHAMEERLARNAFEAAVRRKELENRCSNVINGAKEILAFLKNKQYEQRALDALTQMEAVVVQFRSAQKKNE